MSRLSPFDPDALSGPERDDYEQAVALGYTPAGPVSVWLRSPGMVLPALDLAHHVRRGAALSDRHRELAILMTARACRCLYVWNQHKTLAVESGLAQAVLDAVAERRRPRLDDPADDLVYRVCAALIEDKAVGDALFKDASEVLGERRMVELAGTVGYYHFVAMSLTLFKTPPPDGAIPAWHDPEFTAG